MMMMSVDEKGTFFPMELKLEGNHLKKDTKNKKIRKKM